VECCLSAGLRLGLNRSTPYLDFSIDACPVYSFAFASFARRFLLSSDKTSRLWVRAENFSTTGPLGRPTNACGRACRCVLGVCGTRIGLPRDAPPVPSPTGRELKDKDKEVSGLMRRRTAAARHKTSAVWVWGSIVLM